jgi:hypothetical protein
MSSTLCGIGPRQTPDRFAATSRTSEAAPYRFWESQKPNAAPREPIAPEFVGLSDSSQPGTVTRRRLSDRAVASVKADADRFVKNVAPIIREIQSSGVASHRGITRALNTRGIATARRENPAERRLISLSFCGDHFLDMEGVRGSIPLPPTIGPAEPDVTLRELDLSWRLILALIRAVARIPE